MSKTESNDKLEQIRQARDGNDSSTDGPEVYTCPVEGCSRTVLGNRGHLRNHVSQASDDAHRHRTLTEDLEVVVHWEEMDWSFGVPAFDSAPTVEERELVYDQDVSW